MINSCGAKGWMLGCNGRNFILYTFYIYVGPVYATEIMLLDNDISCEHNILTCIFITVI